jgi:predicted nucleic acid-binding protein
MDIYAESSALLTWLLDEANGPIVERILADASRVITSELTLVECDRAFHRTKAANRISKTRADSLSNLLDKTAQQWLVLRFTPEIIARARGPFPEEPIRALDALHVASALEARTVLPDLALLSLDARVRKVAERLGFRTVPE